ncbi:pilus assembly protein TadG-related protein [Hydrogenophaga sp. ZJX-1]|uniref:pilus assembly protein TadG-related protein n=1 Tax=Hydrogenophaga sp. ZJX-1 TaxID=3404778 RepID=UPI003B28BBF3
MLLKPRQHPAARRERGAVAIILGLTLAVLIGFAGLAIDLGRFFVIKTELQNAMDACALAAASQLRPGQNNPTALTKAIAYGRVFSTGGIDDPATAPLEGNIAAIRNRANFQSTVIDIAANQITFSDTLGGTYEEAGSADYNTAAFAKCTFPLTGLPIFFMRVLNPVLGTQTVSAMAAATLAPSASACAIPVAVCKAPGSTAASNFGLTVGQWMSPPEGAGSPYGTGNFGWIDFTPPGGGASELADLLTGPGQCSTTIGTEVGEPGAISSLDVAWNSRFGLYKPGGGNPQVGSAPPDVTGYSYTTTNWTLGANAYTGTVAGQFNYGNAAANYRPYQTDPPNPYSRLTATQHNNLGRFRRVVVAPVVNCETWNTGGANPVVDGWACVLMLNPMLAVGDVPGLEFLGLSTSAGSPCSTNGEPGTFGPLVPQLVQ